ncbi:MoaD/ThiS family protein [Herbiconiux sp. P15]|uniref:MoaD/ThiS family protein n=1 Tax=Herbiconiux liukaitaii TaxID=3342799 RepID=UPI0035B99D7B
MSVHLRYFAAAKAALGRADDERPAGTTIADLLRTLAAESPDAATTERILSRCTFIHNRTSTDDRTIVLADGDTLDLLPPFAGG